MSDLFYDTLVLIGRHPFWLSSRPVVHNAAVTDRPGAYILAATHTSPYDIPLLMRHTRRRIDFVSIVEVFRNPFMAWLYGSMNAFPLDRSRPDSPTVRIILNRLARGRVVGMFPEGRFRRGEDSVVYSRQIRPGIGRLAQMANVPIVPAVVIDSAAYGRWQAWLPLRRTRYAVAYGDPIEPTVGNAATIEQKLIDTLVSLHQALSNETGLKIR